MVQWFLRSESRGLLPVSWEAKSVLGVISSGASAVVTHTPSQIPTPAIAHAPSQGHSNKGKDRALPPSEIDMHVNPCYPSQLPPVFTQHYAEQEQQLKVMEHEAAKQHDVEHWMKNTVEVYGWSKVHFLRCDFTLCVLTVALGWCRGDYV
jgi:hypothetical protein